MKISTILFLLFLTNSIFGQSQNISSKNAIEDIAEFQRILEKESSYLHTSDYNYHKDIEDLILNLIENEGISLLELQNQLAKILYQIGDRHSRIKCDLIDLKSVEQCDWEFPVFLANYENKIIALKKENESYQIFNANYPYLKSINNTEISIFLDTYLPRNLKAPLSAKWTRGAEDLKDIGEVFHLNNELISNELNFTLTDNKSDSSQQSIIKNIRGRYWSIADIREKFYDDLKEENYNTLTHWIDEKIAYLALPKMLGFERFPKFKTFLESFVQEYSTAENIIIDVRHNSGGQRDILNFLAPYIVPKSQSPWVSNIAFVRSDQHLDEDIESMNSRYLHSYWSSNFDAADRAAIDKFNQYFQFEKDFDKSKFSAPFYMLLKTNETPFEGQIFVLMNERSFSAASVFASALKGLNNVTLVGETTDGSSGRSTKFKLPNSKIEIKISTMLSFQRNGKTLDGNGTEPDLRILPALEMVLGKKDSQLNYLIEHIRAN